MSIYVYCTLIHGISFIHSFAGNKHIWNRVPQWRGGCDVIQCAICLRCFIRPSVDRLFIDYILRFIYLYITWKSFSRPEGKKETGSKVSAIKRYLILIGIVSTQINSVLLARVIHEILRMQADETSHLERARQGVKACAVLFPLLGLTWVFGVLSVTDAGLVFQYIFTIFNSLQVLEDPIC